MWQLGENTTFLDGLFLFCFFVGRAASLAQKTRKHQRQNVTLKAASPCCVRVDIEEGGREGRALIGDTGFRGVRKSNFLM